MKFCIILSAISLALNVPSSLSAAVSSEQPVNSTLPSQANEPSSFRSYETMNLATSLIYKNAAEEYSGNLAFAAFCLITTLIPNYYASAPSSQNPMNSTLRFAFTLDEAKQEFVQLAANIEKYNNKDVTHGGVIYYPKDKKYIKPQFLNILEDLKLTTPEAVNFENPQEVVDKFNQVIAQRTEGTINNLLQVDNVKDAELIQGHAGYIPENFQDKYILLPQPEIFKNNQNTEELVQYIARTGQFKYGRLGSYAWVLQIPLENKAVKLNIFYPDTIGDFEATETFLLSKVDFSEVLTEKSSMLVKLPIFNITSDLNLSQSVQKMGCGPVFQNVNDILNNTVLKVDKIIQKSSFYLTSKGFNLSFASIAVSQERVNNSQSPSPSQAYQLDPSVFSKINASPVKETLNEISLNRPFLFALVAEKSNVPIFYGRVKSISNNAPSKNTKNNIRSARFNKPSRSATAPMMTRAFADLFNVFAKNESGDIAVSLMSLEHLIAPFFYGMKKDIKNYVNESYHLEFFEDIPKQEFRQLFETMRKYQNENTTFGSAIHFQEGKNLISEFFDTLGQYYKYSNPKPVNFSSAQEIAEKINEIIAQSSGGHINNLLRAENIKTAKLVQSNAGHIKERFQDKLSPLSDKYIGRTGQYKHARIETPFKASAVEIPMENPDLGVAIIVCDDNKSFEAAGKLISQLDFLTLFDNESVISIELRPFTVNTYMDLSEAIQQIVVGPIMYNFNGVMKDSLMRTCGVFHNVLVELTTEGMEICFGSVIVNEEQENELPSPSPSQGNQPSASFFSQINASTDDEVQNKINGDKSTYLVVFEKSTGLHMLYVRLSGYSSNPQSNENAGSSN